MTVIFVYKISSLSIFKKKFSIISKGKSSPIDSCKELINDEKKFSKI